jgi:hypothetical protein
MTIEQIVAVPADHRLSFELPHSIPVGVQARVEINIPSLSAPPPSAKAKIEDIRQLLQKEMAETGTLEVRAAAGEGWEAHVREHYAES